MIKYEYITKILDKVGMEYVLIEPTIGEFGDTLDVFDPDMDFEKLRTLIYENIFMRRKISDGDLRRIIIKDKAYEDGIILEYEVKLSLGEDGFGVLMTSKINEILYKKDGLDLAFSGFGMMREYLEKIMMRGE